MSGVLLLGRRGWCQMWRGERARTWGGTGGLYRQRGQVLRSVAHLVCTPLGPFMDYRAQGLSWVVVCDSCCSTCCSALSGTLCIHHVYPAQGLQVPKLVLGVVVDDHCRIAFSHHALNSFFPCPPLLPLSPLPGSTRPRGCPEWWWVTSTAALCMVPGSDLLPPALLSCSPPSQGVQGPGASPGGGA